MADKTTAFTGPVVVGLNDKKGEIRLTDGKNVNEAKYLAIAAPDTITSDTTLTFPNGAGTAGQILSTDGNGTLSWVNDSAGNPDGSNGQVQFNDNGTFGAIPDGTAGQILTSNGAGSAPSFQAAPAGGIAAVVDDTSPQLGGNLDVNGNSITSSSGQNIVLDSAAQVHLDGNSLNSVALFHFGTRYGEFERDGQDFGIKSMLSNANIKITPNGSGNIILDGLTFPNADGSAGQVLTTDGNGNVNFASPAGGGMSWQPVITTNTTATASQGFFVNTSGGAVTLTLPATPTQGDEVAFVDYAGTAATNNITIGRNGENIQGSGSDLIINTNRAANTLVYADATQGWLLKNV